MFIRTTAINRIRALKNRIRVVQGGTNAGKTYAIIPILIDKATKTPRLKITVVAETIPAVKDGAVDIFKNVMLDTNRWRESGWIANPMEYTFGNGSKIQFKAFDSEGKAKASGKRDILFLNEANHIPFNIADALMIRSIETYIDFNPDEEFWVHTEIIPQPNADFLLLTYKDNEAVSKQTLEDLFIKKSKAFFNPNLPDEELIKPENVKSSYWSNWYKVYGLGEIGMLEGVIFSNWKLIDTIPKEAKLIGIGLDFGYTNDPTAIIEVYNYNGQRLINELKYQTGMLNSDIAKLLPKHVPVYADSSEPKSIDEIRRYGITIKGVTKGKDSINYGIDVMQRQDYLVTTQSTNLIKELRAYCWDTDKSGTRLNKPVDTNNHAVDALRYHEMETLGINSNYGTYAIR